MVEVDVRDKGFGKKPYLSDTIQIMKENLDFLPIEDYILRDLESVTGLITAEDAIAQVNVPNFRRSMMDGYAIIHESINNASKDTSINLPIKAENYIGEELTFEMEANSAVKVPTGGLVPDNADTVIKIEDTEFFKNENGQESIKILNVPEKGKNISFVGEDYKKGEILLAKNSRLVFSDIGVLLSVGIFKLKCYKIPKIAIFPTGDELVETNMNLKPGQVYDSTTYVIQELCNQMGFDLKRFSLVKDSQTLLKDRINSLVNEYDIILMTGGTSVGKKDFIPLLIDELGKLYVHGASVRPGSPITAGVIQNKFVVGLPGFPVSTISSFLFFVLPLIFYMLGNYKFKYHSINAKMTQTMKSKKGRKDFLRVELVKDKSGNYDANPIMIAGSSLLRTLNKSNGIVIIEEQVEEIKESQIVEVIPFTWLGKF